MNPDARFLETALAESGFPVTAGYAPPAGQPAPDRPLRPVWGAIWQLPRWARVAFAARCARLMLPEREPGEPESETSRAVELAERTAARGEVASEPADAALVAARALLERGADADAHRWLPSRTEGKASAFHAVYTAHVAAHPAGNPDDVAEHAAQAAAAATRGLAAVAFPGVETARAVASPGEELSQLLRLAREQGWTDATPVTPKVFGPVWTVFPADAETPDPDPTAAESGSK